MTYLKLVTTAQRTKRSAGPFYASPSFQFGSVEFGSLRFGRAYRGKSIPIRIVGGHNPLADVIHPAVEPQVSLSQARRDRGVRAKVLELLNHIAFREREQKLRAGQLSLGFLSGPARGLGVTQPGGHVRKRFECLGVQNALHHAAIGMPANDNVGHAQHPNRVLDGRETPPIVLG